VICEYFKPKGGWWLPRLRAKTREEETTTIKNGILAKTCIRGRYPCHKQGNKGEVWDRGLFVPFFP